MKRTAHAPARWAGALRVSVTLYSGSATASPEHAHGPRAGGTTTSLVFQLQGSGGRGG